MKKVFFPIICTIVIFGCMLIYNVTRINVEEILISDMYAEAKKNNYTLLHVGTLSDSVAKDLNKISSEYGMTMLNTRATEDDIKIFFGDYTNSPEKVEYAVFVNASLQAVIFKDAKEEEIKTILDKVIYHIFPDSEANYKIAKDADEFRKAINSKNYTVAVFGAESCTHCTLYKSTLHEAAGKYKANFYYFDTETYETKEMMNVENLGLVVPAKCTINEEDTDLKGKYPKPLTLIIKNGKTVDCIKGNVNIGTVDTIFKELRIGKVK